MPNFDARGNTPVSDRFTEGGHNNRGNIGSLVIPPVTPPESVDTAPPVVTFISPLPLGGAIAPDTDIVLEVTEESAAGLSIVFVWAILTATGDAEVVHDGTNFTTRYSFSARENITDGFRYTLRRVGGWPSSPRIQVKALDTSGNASS